MFALLGARPDSLFSDFSILLLWTCRFTAGRHPEARHHRDRALRKLHRRRGPERSEPPAALPLGHERDLESRHHCPGHRARRVPRSVRGTPATSSQDSLLDFAFCSFR
jgi:hypothetical protein